MLDLRTIPGYESLHAMNFCFHPGDWLSVIPDGRTSSGAEQMVFLDWDRDECRHAPIFPGSFEEFAKPLKDGWLVIKYKEAPKSVLFVSNDRLERLPDTHGTLIENIRRAFQEDDDHERHSGCSGWRKRRRDFHPLHGSEVGGVAEAVPVLPPGGGDQSRRGHQLSAPSEGGKAWRPAVQTRRKVLHPALPPARAGELPGVIRPTCRERCGV